MVEVFGAQVARQSNDVTEPTGTLGLRSGEPGPFDGQRRTDIRLGSRLRKRREAREHPRFRSEGATGGTPDRDVRVHGGYHGCTSGHGCAIVRSALTSTLA